jgi:hypothetical protein
MTDTTGLTVYWLVVAARFLVPLTIPRYPLPGVVASMLLDAADQTIFQQFPSIALEGYQGYDKALDIYYLAIAYISTMRNWSNLFAFQVSRFLFYWRLVGVVLFELMHLRPLLLIFPNTFEYFFIFYEDYRLRWDPMRMTNRFVIGAAAFIWIVIKLPQEYWLHIAQMDLTNFIKENIFGMPVDAPWSEIIAASPVICIGSIVIVALFLVGIIWVLARRLPPADRRPELSADANQPKFTTDQVRRAIVAERRHIVDAAMGEKIVLVTLICVIFTQILPGVVATTLQVIIGIGLLVTINTVLSHWLAQRGFGWAFSFWQSIVLFVVNSCLFLGYAFLMSRTAEPIQLVNAMFFVVLLTLLITLYDRYRQVYLMRFALRE